MIVSVYIHIPFCSSKCDFCDLAAIAGLNNLEDDYCQIICNEIEGRLGHLDEKPNISSIFYGGGTPGLLEPAKIAKIQEKLLKYIHIAERAEITLETTPSTISPAKVAQWLDIGINRLSIGVQSLNDGELSAIGRADSSKQALAGICQAVTGGFTNVACDLIYGLPSQTQASWEKSLNTLLALAHELKYIQHISAYALSIGQNSPLLHRFARNSQIYPDEEQYKQMYELLVLTLAQAGFMQYEISNFSKIDYQSRHNLSYWNNSEYQAFGMSSHRYLDGIRSSNWRSLKRYMKDCLGLESSEVIDSQTKLKEAIMLGLRLTNGIDLAGFEQEYGINLLTYFSRVIEKLVSGNFLEHSGGSLKLTPKAVLVSNSVISEFFP